MRHSQKKPKNRKSTSRKKMVKKKVHFQNQQKTYDPLETMLRGGNRK